MIFAFSLKRKEHIPFVYNTEMRFCRCGASRAIFFEKSVNLSLRENVVENYPGRDLRWKLPGDLSLTTAATLPAIKQSLKYIHVCFECVSVTVRGVDTHLRNWSNATNALCMDYREGREDLTRYHLAGLKSCVTSSSIEIIDKRPRWN